ncbi:putative flavin-binding monooxygenase [Trichodelitschia bisporula]|uniref:Putative flavin-binding monooxygenase n=1 Tax=Trichodelitschia bisporula TaxID=703511 RepID=A0A6G1I1V9_9PEZI|nr:putative flavin-binding monooxygenase [Trichodelitschia bisporula]
MSPTTSTTSVDVLILGAGISGLNSAYRIQTQAPKGTTYTILEARDQLGGTWDFFKYPGLRSDSDLHTFGFAWHPWTARIPIADGDSICTYLREAAAKYGLDKQIRFRHRATKTEWDSGTRRWRVTAGTPEGERVFEARWLVVGTGYYDYDKPLEAVIPGLQNFKGTIVHPQFWPTNLDYAGKRVVIIGSGATAVTLLPVLAETAARVTMLQRSPGYILALPQADPVGKLLHAILPQRVASWIDRMRFMLVAYSFYYFCRAWPGLAKAVLAKATAAQLPPGLPVKPHFEPRYNPWEQRLCLCPDGDFFQALRAGKADVATGVIREVKEGGVELMDGTFLPADVLVTATGLKILFAGGVELRADGERLEPGEKFMWKGVMMQDVPNASFVIGYPNASWTLGADATAQMTTRLLRMMKEKGAAAVVPRLDVEGMQPSAMLNLSSTYLEVAKDRMPKAGTVGQWRPRGNYFGDMWQAKYGDVVSGLEWVPEREEEVKVNGVKENGTNGHVRYSG